MKKLMIIMFFLSFLFQAVEVKAEEVCVCAINVDGSGCNIDNSRFVANIGQEISLSELLESVSVLDCPISALASTIIPSADLERSIVVTKEQCSNLGSGFSGENNGYSYSVNCRLTSEDTEGASLPVKSSSGSSVGSNNCTGESCQLPNPLPFATDVPTLIGIVIKGALSIIGALSLFVFVQGGFQWLTSAGNPEKVKSGSAAMIWAAVGLLVTFASYLVLSTLLNNT